MHYKLVVLLSALVVFMPNMARSQMQQQQLDGGVIGGGYGMAGYPVQGSQMAMASGPGYQQEYQYVNGQPMMVGGPRYVASAYGQPSYGGYPVGYGEHGAPAMAASSYGFDGGQAQIQSQAPSRKPAGLLSSIFGGSSASSGPGGSQATNGLLQSIIAGGPGGNGGILGQFF